MTATPAPTRERTVIALWNPNGAANWSLLFTPLFGAYLHMLNWRSLGEAERAATSRKWFYAGVSLGVAIVVLEFLLDISGSDPVSDGELGVLWFVFLLFWYFGSACAQATYVKVKFGTSYVHRSWEKPLGVAVAVIIGLYVLPIALFLSAEGISIF